MQTILVSAKVEKVSFLHVDWGMKMKLRPLHVEECRWCCCSAGPWTELVCPKMDRSGVGHGHLSLLQHKLLLK